MHTPINLPLPTGTDVPAFASCSQKNTRDRATQQLLRRPTLIRTAFLEEKSKIPELELIITGDFNCWDSLSSGNQVINHPRQGELISFIANLGLQCVLPRGTIIYSARGSGSTIDLIFASEQLVDNLESCRVYPNNPDMDHELLQSKFVIETASPTKVPQLLFKEAP